MILTTRRLVIKNITMNFIVMPVEELPSLLMIQSFIHTRVLYFFRLNKNLQKRTKIYKNISLCKYKFINMFIQAQMGYI